MLKSFLCSMVFFGSMICFSSQQHNKIQHDVAVQVRSHNDDQGETEQQEVASLNKKLTGLSSQIVGDVWKDFYTKTNITEPAEQQWANFFKPRLNELEIVLPEVQNLVDRNSVAFSLIVQKLRKQLTEEL